ncbi:MAG TPA: DUF1269 domain-containing protein [Bryobacteraceae bacterium]|jgi:uncharacterized membrane protein|nr:DUF1269 domain-containing protein [Bryobacteraceae bacterium]
MSELVAVSYPDVYRAGEVCAALQRLQREFLIDMEDIAYVTRDQDGKIKLHQTQPVASVATGIGASRGTIWGALIGLLFMQPLLGMAAGAVFGAASGAIAGRMADFGIPDPFMKDLAGKLQPGTSMLFVLFRKITWEKILPEISQYGGTVMHSSLTPEAEARLQSALAEGAEPKKAA